MGKLQLLNLNNLLSDLAGTCSKSPNKQISEDVLRAAAIIVQSEYRQKGDWYNALVDSIAQYLRTIPANKGIYNVAEGLADQIIGIEKLEGVSMDKMELARLINGREYDYEPFKDVRQVAKEAGLVIVSGASDDLMEFDGAIHDEGGCFDGGKVFFDRNGVSQDDSARANFIQAFWCNENALDENGNVIAWTYETKIPHETFMIYEDGEPYCRGIVFDLADIKEG